MARSDGARPEIGGVGPVHGSRELDPDGQGGYNPMKTVLKAHPNPIKTLLKPYENRIKTLLNPIQNLLKTLAPYVT